MIKTFLLSLVISLSVFSFLKAQSLMPQPSSGQTIIQDFGLGKITLVYSRPNLKGREVFGKLEPYGQVWRTGANSATKITFSDEVKLAGNIVPAGTYSLFTIPTENEWTIILNKKADQWGAYDYKESDDLLRFKIKPVKLKEPVETLSIQFAKVLPGSAEMHFKWENVGINIPLTTEYDAKVMANIEKAMQGEKKPYFQSAIYYYENNKDLAKALTWMNEAEKADAKAPWVKLWKAKLQLKMGDKAAAKTTATQGLALAKEAKNEEYIRLNQQLITSIK